MRDIAIQSYTAGVMDSDGCIYAYLRSNGALDMKLDVVNSNVALMEWLTAHWGGSFRQRKAAKPWHKRCYSWVIWRQYAVDILQEIAPFMVLKAKQARVFIELWENRGDGRGGYMKGYSGLPDSILKLRERYVAELNDLNRKGVEVS